MNGNDECFPVILIEAFNEFDLTCKAELTAT